MYERLADFVAVVHGLVVVFVAAGTLLIVLGLWRGWAIARQFHFRYAHLLLILAVNVFEWCNLPCPLTRLEWHLREKAEPAQEVGFIQHYVTNQIHVEVEPSLIARLTVPLLILVAALYAWKGPVRGASGDKPAILPWAHSWSRPPPWRIALSILAVLTVSVCAGPLASALTRAFYVHTEARFSEAEWLGYAALLALAFALCLISPRLSGLGLGRSERWRRWDLPAACVMAVPPLMVAAVYARLTSRPFNGLPAPLWFLGSAAQELFFAGFVYARLSEVFGEPSDAWRDAFAWPVLFTAVLFAAYHWQNAQCFTGGYFAFQLVYTCLGMWWTLNLRRWTGSVWPGVVLHILVNYLAANV